MEVTDEKEMYVAVAKDGTWKDFMTKPEMDVYLKDKDEDAFERLKIRYTLSKGSKYRKSKIMYYPRIIWRDGLTDIEQLVLDGLLRSGYREGVDFIVQHGMEGRKYVMDFAFTKEGLDVEADGEYWHETCKRRGEDGRRDEFLRDEGWTVLRFDGDVIKSDVDGVVRTISSKLIEIRGQ